MAVVPIRRQSAQTGEITSLISAINKAATLANACKTDLATLVAKLNADGGVTDANYAAAASQAATTADTLVESY